MLSILPPQTITSRSTLMALGAALVTTLAAWLSQGTIAYSGAGSERVALLPISPLPIAVAIAAGATMLLAIRRGLSPAPLMLLGLLFLPWLPIALPAALLLWTGPLAILVWVGVAAAMAPRFVRITSPGRPQVVAGVLAFAIGAVAWWQVAPQVPGGDEPHYLVITQSLLKDGDLDIRNNHRRRDYASFAPGVLPPHVQVLRPDGRIYSIHAPGLPAVVAPAFAIGGYSGAVLLLLAIAASGSALAWHLAWLVTGRTDAAWFGWAAVTLSVTWIFHSFTIYPDGPGAVLLLTGVWALLRTDDEKRSLANSVTPWLWHGAALAALPWMHSRFSVLAGGIAALVLLRLAQVPNPASKAFAFLLVPIVSALGWFGYFIALYGTPNPSAPYAPEPASFAFVPDGLAGLLFDQRFGLLAYAPVLLFALIGIGVMLARPAWRRQALELLFVVLPYLVVVTHFAMWWGGRSAPARFFVPVLLWMAIPAAAVWASMTRRSTRLTAIGALLVTAFASAVLVFVQDGALAFNAREIYAQWLEWLNGTVNLARALPVWWRDTEVALFRGIVVWLAAGVAAWLVLRALERNRRVRLTTAAVLVYALAASAAAAVTWKAEGVPGRLTTPSQLEALRRLSADRWLLALTLSPPGHLQRGDVAARLRLFPEFSTAPGGAGRNDRPLFAVPALPAGEYRLRPFAEGSAGWLMIGIGRDQFAIRTVPLEEALGSLVIRLPVEVQALLVRGDEEARRNVKGLQIDPIRLVRPEHRLARGNARRAVRYEASTAWFLDDRSFPEREAFWVAGERSSEIVIQPDRPHPAETLLLRNGAAENTVLIETKGWRESLGLGAGEERRVQVPSDVARGAAWLRITTSAGFTPSEVDPNSRDHRFLGVWVKVEG
jgi:hypothetical protein